MLINFCFLLSKKTVIECIHGLMSQVLKDQLVNKVKNPYWFNSNSGTASVICFLNNTIVFNLYSLLEFFELL